MIKYYKNLTQNFLTLIPYITEFNILNTYSTLKGHPLRDQEKHKRLKKQMIKYIETCLAQDAKLCTDLNVKRQKIGPIEVAKHFLSLINVYRDYEKILITRNENDLKTDTDYPEYFNRKYHFQTDGYTSEHSASLYDHQVDLLFAGMAGPMRRTILEELRGFSPKNIVELGCGTGSGTEIVAKHLKDSRIIATDLSHEYISFAQKKHKLENVEFKQMNGLKLSGEFDFIYHVFLLHELPSKERRELLKKQVNSLTLTGKGVILESLQKGDIPFLDEVLDDFPKYYHEPFYKHYIENPVELELEKLGAKNIQVTKRLFSKVISFSK